MPAPITNVAETRGQLSRRTILPQFKGVGLVAIMLTHSPLQSFHGLMLRFQSALLLAPGLCKGKEEALMPGSVLSASYCLTRRAPAALKCCPSSASALR
jgi:hypothetical protein